MTFYVGDTVRISTDITDPSSSAAVDPTTVTFKVKSPSAVVSTYVYGTHTEVSKSGTGSYHADIPVTAAGRWLWRIEVEGVVDGVDEGALQVTASQF